MNAPEDGKDLWQQVVEYALRFYPWHLAFFIGFNVLLTALNVWTGSPWWALWPLVITGGLFLVHFLVYKTALVDDAWVDERASELFDRSYDQGHIQDIAGRHDLETPLEREAREFREREARRRAESRRPPQSSGE